MSTIARDIVHKEWTDDDLHTMRHMWGDGKSAADIGLVLGRTRNAILGKVHRIGLATTGHVNGTLASHSRTPRYNPPKKRLKAKAKTYKPFVRKHAAPAEPPPIPIDVSALRGRAWEPLEGITPKPLELLGHRECKWPIGPDTPFLFCAGQTEMDSSWCPIHSAMAFFPKPLARL